MSGVTELETLLSSLQPKLMTTEFVFCTVQGELVDYILLNPIATFQEAEGLTIVLTKKTAVGAGLTFENTFKQITLSVHSSLDAVGLTAAISVKLTENGISANVIAAYYHDHIFVPSDKAVAALAALTALSHSID